MAIFQIIDKEIGDEVGQQYAGSCLRNPNAWRQLNLTHGKPSSHLTEAMEICNFDWGEQKQSICVMCSGSS